MLRVPVHEDFNVRRFISDVKQLKNTVVTTAQKKLAFHFDVSCYAPYEILDSVLYSMLFGGVIVDEDSGEVLDVSSLGAETHIFIEMGLAPKNEPSTSPYAPYSKTENVKSALPTVSIFGNPEKIVSKLHIGQRECLCAAFFQAYHRQKNPDTNPLTIKPLATAEAEVELQKLFSGQAFKPKHDLPRVAPLQRSFLNLLHERIQLFIQRVQSAVNWFQVIGQDTQDLLSTPTRHGYFDFVIFFELFLEECAYLSKQSLLLESISPTCTIPLLSAPEEGEYIDINFYDFGGTRYVPKAASKAFDNHKVEANPASVTHIDIEKQWQVPLRRALGAMYNVPSQKMPYLTESFVLTPEFALALIVLKARMTVGRTIVWQGGTGVGKSELLSFFAKLLNHNSNALPDAWGKLQDLFTTVILPDLERQPFEREGRIRQGFGWAASRAKAYNISQHAQLIELFLELSTIDVNVQISGEKDVTPIFPFVAYHVANHCLKIAKDYPRIHKTPAMLAVINSKTPQPTGMATIQDKSLLESAPIPKSEILEQVLKDLLYVYAEGIYSRMLMTNTKTSAEIREWVLNLNKNAQTMTVVGFIDEGNTTSYMGLLKEILCDHSLDGTPLAQNLFFVTAENPADEELSQQETVSTMSIDQKSLDHRGIKATASDDRQFTVRISAPSLRCRQMKFFDFDPTFEGHFLLVLFNTQAARFGLLGQDLDFIRELVTAGQRILRKHPTKKIHVSIRDIMARVLKLLKYFLTRPEGIILLGLENHPTRGREEQRFKLGLTMSLCITYFFRFTRGSPFRVELCSAFDALMQRKWQGFNFHDEVHKCLDHFFVRCELSKSLAPTFALKEIIYCTITCIDACVPLAIVGPAGCGKTLGFSLALECMKGSAALKELFKSLKQMIEFRYQCSVHSTDKEIREVYESAVKRQRGLEQGNKQKCRIQCTVLLDEASLPKDQNLVIKETHDYLDHPVAATVILSNNTPDVPNTNRCVLLLEPELSEDDLVLVRVDNFCLKVHLPFFLCPSPLHPPTFSFADFASWVYTRYLART